MKLKTAVVGVSVLAVAGLMLTDGKMLKLDWWASRPPPGVGTHDDESRRLRLVFAEEPKSSNGLVAMYTHNGRPHGVRLLTTSRGRAVTISLLVGGTDTVTSDIDLHRSEWRTWIHCAIYDADTTEKLDEDFRFTRSGSVHCHYN